MKILLDAIRFAYQRVDTVILNAGLYEQDKCRLIEARDELANAAAKVMGQADAQAFLQDPDNYRLRLDQPHGPEDAA